MPKGVYPRLGPLMANRVCYGCGSTKTLMIRGRYPRWYVNGNDVLCHLCYNKYFEHPKSRKKRIHYKTHQVYVPINPRKGVCTQCNKRVGVDCQKTVMHHIQYHDDDPLKDTIELCNACHVLAHQRIRQNRR